MDSGHPVVVCGRYEGPIRRALLAFKQSGKRAYGRVLAELMARAYETVRPLGGMPTVVEVPAVSSRQRYRGYNPAGVLADELAHRLGLPRMRPLVCAGELPEQKGLSCVERRSNKLEGFRIMGSIRGPCLLVDDVVTTGTTAGHCLRLLQEKGAEPLAVLALARSVRRAA
ncbi:MAG: ComF family protein [Armatimonadetes bacterium]|nr:ComF family protein [Armatimonadota bacterium]